MNGGTPALRWALVFLSCLYGSELSQRFMQGVGFFLSCLYGSEHGHDCFLGYPQFLSRLYGSEQKYHRQTATFSVSELPVRQ